MTAALLFIAFGVGALIGAVGIGGVLMVAALAMIGKLDIHEAAATALFTFIFTGVLGTWFYRRRGSIDWRITVPLCLGAVFFGFVGAWVNSMMGAGPLALILAGVIIFAGVYTLAAWHGAPRTALSDRPSAQQALLGGVGAVSGFGSGLTGVGGPALSVPLMVLFGFPTLASVGASQVIQIIAAISGTLGNLRFGTINWSLVLPLTVVELAGVLVGAWAAHAVNQVALRRFVGILCIPVGIFLVARALNWL